MTFTITENISKKQSTKSTTDYSVIVLFRWSQSRTPPE